MSVELRLLKDAVTGLPFVPVTHWDAVSNKPNIDGSLNSINASLNAIDASVKTLDASINVLDASIKNINIPIKSITGEAGLIEYANSEFVAVSVSEPDENGNVSIDASVKVVTLADASNGIDGIATAGNVYTELTNIEEVIATSVTTLANTLGLNSSLNIEWSEESGLTEDTIKEAIEYVSMNAGVKINDSSIDSSTVWSSLKISDELNNIDIVQINDSSIDASLVWSSKKVDNELYDVLPENKKYLTFEAIEDGSIGWYNNSNNEIQATVLYSFDRIEWNDFELNGENPVYISVPAGSKLYCRGINPNGVEGDAAYYNDSPNGFVLNTGQWNVSGNIMSIIDYENLDLMITMIGNFYYLFSNDEGFKAGSTLDIVNANNLILPATILTIGCYSGMFLGCSSLTSVPVLHATTLAEHCYEYMFLGCSSLTSAPELPAITLANLCYFCMFYSCASLASAPELPATTLATNCYYEMFLGCSSLTIAPELPATTLANYCYWHMFKDCSSLTSAPELPATTLVERCYYGMFLNCSNLNYIKCLATSGINTNDSTINWVTGVASAGTFVKDPNATWPIGNNGIPTGWNVINLSSEQIYENGHIYNSSVNSIAEGVINGSINNTIVEQSYATGINSHVEGIGTQALNTAEHAEGKYNQSHENQTIHSIGIGTSNEDRKNAFEVTQDGSIYVYGLGNYDGTNPANAETLLNSLADLIPITYDDLLQKVNSKLLIPGKKYLITDYITKINNSAFTSLEKKYDGIVCEAISNFELSRVNCTAILSYEGSGPNEDVYIWIDNFPESIIEDEPDILQNYHDNFREYFEGSKLHRLGQIEFESESYWLWEYVTNNGFGSDKWIPNVLYALTLESDFEGNTLLDDVTNINRPILYYLGSDKSQIDYGNDGTKHDEYAWVVVKQEKYTYDPATITSNTIYVEKFSYDPLSNDIDLSYYEETNFYEEGAGSTNEYKLRGTLEWDDNEYYLWELTDGHAIDNDQTQYSWMLTKTADFRGLSLLDDYENNRYCPCFCFLNEDKSEAYLDENDNYQNHEILLIQAVYDPSLPEVEPLSGGGGETKVVEYEIGYDITKQFDGHKGTILYMQDEYGNSANFDFKNIKSKKYGFLFGGENDLTLNGTYKENKVLGELREFSICSETCYGSTFTQNCLGTIYQDLENCEVSYDNNQFVVFDPYHHETLNTILIEHQKNIEDIDTVTSSLLVNHEDRIRELEAKIEQLMNA